MRTGWMWGVAALALVSACSVRSDQNTTTNANVADTTPEGPSLSAKLFGGGKPTPLDVQQPLANGAIIYLTSLQAKPTETVLGVRIVNGADKDIQLNWTSDQKTFLAAGGQKYFLSPPVENKNLSIAKGAKMEGELVFLGRLPRDSAVTLVFNDGMDNGAYESTPGISIPIPVTKAAWSDDGSKKKSVA